MVRARRQRGPGRRRATAAGLALACAVGAGASAASAGVSVWLSPAAGADTREDKRRADARVADLEEALEDTSAELVAAYEALQATQAQLGVARARLTAAQRAARAAATHNDEVAARLAIARANEARAVESLDKNTAAQEQTQKTLDAFAADLFQGGGSGQLSVALGATSADDFATRLVLADTVSALTNSALDDLAAARADGAATRAYLQAVRVEVADLKQQAEAALASANAARADAETAKVALDELTAQQQTRAAEVENRKATELAQLQAAQQEQAQLQAELVEQARLAREAEERRKAEEARRKAEAAARGQTYTPPPPRDSRDTTQTAQGFLDPPVRGARVSSEFGYRFHPIYHIWKLHSGIDFAAACGTPVYAAAAGTVIRAGWGGGYGNRIVIDHGIQRGVDLVTTYNHLSRFAVGGGEVARGQLIGFIGTTGTSTGCHLHLETLEDGTFVNPRRWL